MTHNNNIGYADSKYIVQQAHNSSPQYIAKNYLFAQLLTDGCKYRNLFNVCSQKHMNTWEYLFWLHGQLGW